MATLGPSNFLAQEDQTGDKATYSDNLRLNKEARGNESPSFATPHQARGDASEKDPPQNISSFYSFMENQMIECVKASLNNELFANATFLCERLYA